MAEACSNRPVREISVPERHAKALYALAALEKSSLTEFYKALSEVPLQLFPWNDVQRAADNLVGTTTDAAAVMAAVRGVHMARQSHALETDAEFVQGALAGAMRHVGEDRRESMQSVIVNLLSLQNIYLSNKAARLRIEAAQHMHDFAVFVDLRPVFDQDGTGIAGAILMGELKIEYSRQEGMREFYLSVDETDLELMEVAIARARRKLAALKNSAASAGMNLIEAHPHE